MCLNDDLILFLRPFILADVRVEMVVPALSTLLAYPTRKVFGHKAPILRAVAFDQLQH